MLDQDHLRQVKEKLSAYELARREIIKFSGDALSAAKRAIFALHRDDRDKADQLLDASAGLLGRAGKLIEQQPELAGEGSFRAGLEEYVEAALYRQYLTDGRVGRVDNDHVDYGIYLAALCDLVGEMQRRQVRLATEGDVEGVRQIRMDIEEVIVAMLEMDLGGYLRNKFDQAKNALRRAEDILYEVSLRKG